MRPAGHERFRRTNQKFWRTALCRVSIALITVQVLLSYISYRKQDIVGHCQSFSRTLSNDRPLFAALDYDCTKSNRRL